MGWLQKEQSTSERADAGTVPILALSANAFEEDIQKSKRAGMNAHLTKPIEPDELYRVLGAMVGK